MASRAPEAQRLAEYAARYRAWVTPRVSDTIIRTQIIGHGFPWFAAQFHKEFRGFGKRIADDQHAKDAFALLCMAHVQAFGDHTPTEVLDAIEPVTPPTAKEIADAWTIDSASSEEGRRMLYGVNGHPREILAQVVAEERDRGAS